jgi:hypothetical protein
MNGVSEVGSLPGCLDPLSREQIFHLLSNRRRREVLLYLFGERSAPLDELVDQIAARELDRETDVADSDHRAAVYTSLYQTHIPELADAGIVVYDPEQRRVALTGRGWRLRSYLNGPRNEGSVWSRVFLVESALWIVILLAARSGVPLVSAVPVLWLLTACLVTFSGTALVYAWRTTWRM